VRNVAGVLDMNRGVRWQTDCLPKRIRGLLRVTKRFFRPTSRINSDELHPLENFDLFHSHGGVHPWLFGYETDVH
jgi:hypothetical protein